MFYLANAQFHISLIPRRWYNNNKYHIDQNEENITPIYQIGGSKLDEMEQPLSFQYLANFRQTPNVVQLQGPKQKYRFGMGYAKKALDLAIRTDKVDEFVNQMKCFIESTKKELSDQQENIDNMHIGDLLQVQHKGRQPNRYKSGGKPLKKKARRIIQDIINTINKDHEEEV